MTRTSKFLSMSIALNIFLLGSIGGAAFWFARDERMIMAGSLRIAGSELPANERRQFRMRLKAARRSMGDRLAEAREARGQAAALLRQPTVDIAAVTAALEKARTAELAIRSVIEARALDFVATLPQDDRGNLANAMERRGKLRANADD